MASYSNDYDRAAYDNDRGNSIMAVRQLIAAQRAELTRIDIASRNHQIDASSAAERRSAANREIARLAKRLADLGAE